MDCAGISSSRSTKNIIRSRRSCRASSPWFILARPMVLYFPVIRGIPRTLSPASYTSFAPRIGLAYSPNFSRRNTENDFRKRREKQHPGGFRNVLHRVSRIIGRHHVRRSSLRLQLSESRPAAVRQAFHHCGGRHEYRAAVPVSGASSERVGKQSSARASISAITFR